MLKKKFTYLLMAMAMMFTVTSCGDDVETLITGKTLKNTEWSGSFTKMKDGVVEEVKPVTMNFDSDNHGTYVLNDKTCEFDFAINGTKFSLMHGYYTDVNGIYEMESTVLGNTLVMSKTEGNRTETFKLNRGNSNQDK